MTRLTACLIGLLAAGVTAAANSPDPATPTVPPEKLSRARALVRQLGSESYRDRERATRELRQMGRYALTVLADAAEATEDPEVKARCGDLLRSAEADDMAVRVAAFLADPDGRQTHDLPGWEPYRAVAGDDPAARKLFADVLRNRDNHALLIATRTPDERLSKALVARRQLIQYRINPAFPLPPTGPIKPPAVSDLAAVLLAESLAPEQTPVAAGGPQYFTSTFFNSPAGREAVATTGVYGPAFRKLTLRWLDTRQGPNGLWTAVSLARSLPFDADEVNRIASRVLTAEGASPAVKGQALTMLANGGTPARDQLPVIAKMFADKAVVRRVALKNGEAEDVQVRDAALAAVVLITRQDPTAYGLEPVEPLTGFSVNPSGYCFRSGAKPTPEQKREAAFKKWAEWEAKNRDSEAKP